ncbi:MAG: hypothetical protein EOS07_35190 [Mesorhizobium sp.]|nr:MAG: hypothetical protein EOS07_35190 [Mesorhizobium sp.]
MALAWPGKTLAGTPAPLTRIIPSTGEAISAVGLGTWITVKVGDDPVLRDECADVIAASSKSEGRQSLVVGSTRQSSASRLKPAAVLQGSSASSGELSTAALFLFATDCSCGACCFRSKTC